MRIKQVFVSFVPEKKVKAQPVSRSGLKLYKLKENTGIEQFGKR
jgi:hypothetical protein